MNGFQATGTATFPGHKFFFGRNDDPNDALCSFLVQAGTFVYYCDPYSKGQGGPSRGITTETRDVNGLDGHNKQSKIARIIVVNHFDCPANTPMITLASKLYLGSV